MCPGSGNDKSSAILCFICRNVLLGSTCKNTVWFFRFNRIYIDIVMLGWMIQSLKIGAKANVSPLFSSTCEHFRNGPSVPIFPSAP